MKRNGLVIALLLTACIARKPHADDRDTSIDAAPSSSVPVSSAMPSASVIHATPVLNKIGDCGDYVHLAFLSSKQLALDGAGDSISIIDTAPPHTRTTIAGPAGKQRFHDFEAFDDALAWITGPPGERGKIDSPNGIWLWTLLDGPKQLATVKGPSSVAAIDPSEIFVLRGWPEYPPHDLYRDHQVLAVSRATGSIRVVVDRPGTDSFAIDDAFIYGLPLKADRVIARRPKRGGAIETVSEWSSIRGFFLWHQHGYRANPGDPDEPSPDTPVFTVPDSRDVQGPRSFGRIAVDDDTFCWIPPAISMLPCPDAAPGCRLQTNVPPTLSCRKGHGPLIVMDLPSLPDAIAVSGSLVALAANKAIWLLSLSNASLP